ncbi:MAG: hypothetical protein LQ350_007995 [Teloschistes chrysophthalmus]|nr:MAG: hypothetical protein LQ350_007995 [Niorma chrysophthalma]
MVAWKVAWGRTFVESESAAVVKFGMEGWAGIKSVLQRTLETSQELDQQSRKLEDRKQTRSILPWRRTIERQTRKDIENDHASLRQLIGELNWAFEQLQVCSETGFDSKNLRYDIQTRPTILAGLQEVAIRSRALSMQLFDLCTSHREEYSFELNLLGDQVTWEDLAYPRGKCNFLQFLLLIEPKHQSMRKLLVKEGSPTLPESTHTANRNLQLFQARPEATVVEYAREFHGVPCHLDIPAPSDIILLKSVPKPLAAIIDEQGGSKQDPSI